MNRPGEPTPAQWSARYEAGDTPWDLGGPHPELVRRLADDPGLGGTVGRALVPGCGTGHDAVALARAGWEVLALDVAPAVEPTVTRALAPWGGRFLLGDALELADETVDLVFDHTLFCALPLRRRPEFGTLCRRVLPVGGQVVSVVFPLDRALEEGGPPFGMSVDDVGEALGADFWLAEASEGFAVAGRAWAHRWARWERAGR